MKVKANGNVKEQVLRGIEPQENLEIEINLSAMSPALRAVLVREPEISVVEGTQAEVEAALQMILDKEATDAARKAAEQAERDQEARQFCAEAQPDERKQNDYGIGYSVYGVPYFNTYGLSPAVADLVKETIARLSAEAEQKNVEVRKSVEPLIEVAKRAHAEKEAAAKQAAEAEKQAKFAKRLETGVVEIPMERGSRQEWGEPWIAKLSSRNGKRPEYDFSQGSYDAATEVLSIPCVPGEVIAYGQKNYRKPKRTIHEVKKMTDSGALVSA